jgi:hypothetical protein
MRYLISFRCPVCHHASYAAPRVLDGTLASHWRSFFLCEKCGAHLTPKNFTLVSLLAGAIFGVSVFALIRAEACLAVGNRYAGGLIEVAIALCLGIAAYFLLSTWLIRWERRP